jgi:hypothetical protein
MNPPAAAEAVAAERPSHVERATCGGAHEPFDGQESRGAQQLAKQHSAEIGPGLGSTERSLDHGHCEPVPRNEDTLGES